MGLQHKATWCLLWKCDLSLAVSSLQMPLFKKPKLSRLHHGCFDTNPVQKQLAPDGVRIGIRPTQSPQIAYLTKKASGYLVRTMIKGTGHAFSNEEDRDFVKLHVKRQQFHLGVLWIYLSMANILIYACLHEPWHYMALVLDFRYTRLKCGSSDRGRTNDGISVLPVCKDQFQNLIGIAVS